MCQLCRRKVDIGSFTGTYALHNKKGGDVCLGSSKEIPHDLLPKAKKPGQAKRKKRGKFLATTPSASLIAQFEVNQTITIQKSLSEEREVRRAAREENTSNSSVRAICGGLPTLGKR